MALTDRLVLPVDVSIRPVAELSPRLQERLKAAAGDYAITRPRRRQNAKLLSPPAAGLLQEFREPRLVGEAVLNYARRNGLDPETVLEEAFEVLGACYEAAFLVPEGSPQAAPVLASRERGDRLAGGRVLRCVRVLDDTELYQCRAPDGALVAVKQVRPGADPAVLPQLLREEAVLRRLDGEGAPRFVRRGRNRTGAWLAMAWRDGTSPEIVFGQLREQRTAEARTALGRLATAVAARYAVLHARGILHGDVHQGNILVDRREQVTLLDFGMAHPLPPLSLPGTGGIGGVAPYYAPEEASELLAGRDQPPPTPRSEQFRLAALLDYLLTGRPWADFDLSRLGMLRTILEADPLPFTARRVPAWPAMERVLRRALAREPAERYETMAAFAEALGAVTPDSTADRAGASRGREFERRVVEEVGLASLAAHAERGVRAPHASLMFGRAGLAYALHRLAALRGEPEWLSLADVWLSRAERDVAEGASDAFASPEAGLEPDVLGPVSPFHAVSGLHLCRSLIGRAMGDDRMGVAAATAYARCADTPWDSLDPTMGRPALLLGTAILLDAHRAGPAEERLRATGQREFRSLLERLETAGRINGGAFLPVPSVAHGWAGALYAALLWTAVAGDPPAEALRQRLDELAGLAESVGRGVHWVERRQGPVAEGRRADSSWCHGPAGFGFLWTLAHRIWGVPEDLALAEACGWTTWDDRDMFPTLCCGLAGRAYSLLNLYRHTGETDWLERARTLGERAARSAEHPGAAFDFPLSLYKGRPGIALLQADLAHPDASCMPIFEPEGWSHRAVG